MVMTRLEERQLRNADAKNRTVRTFIQGLLIDIAVGLAALVLAQLGDVNDKAALIAFGVSAAKTVVQSAAAYVMRMFVDTKLRRVLPPQPPGEPAAPNRGG